MAHVAIHVLKQQMLVNQNDMSDRKLRVLRIQLTTTQGMGSTIIHVEINSQ